MFFWPTDYMRSCDKLKTKYFFPQKTYSHHTLKSADKWWGEANNKATWIWWRNHKTSRVKLKKLTYSLLQCLYHQTCKGVDVWWQETTDGVPCVFDYVVLCHMKNLKRNITSPARPMTSSLAGERALPIKLNDHWPFSFCKAKPL